MKNKGTGRNGWKQFLSREIIIDYKTCLYFYCVMIFYCVYLAFLHIYFTSVLYMFEMLAIAYVITYIQVYVFHNFDEAEQIGKSELFATLVCSTLYTAASYLFGWFDRNPLATFSFFCYMPLCYWCLYLTNKIKRKVDTKLLNEMLEDYKNSADISTSQKK